MPVGYKLIALLSTSFPLRPSLVFRLARYSRPTFAALSYAPAFHGRIHSVFNRPKLGFCSGAINQFHSEAVIKEGCGEAATSFSDSKNSHPWPEWSNLADILAEKGYSDRCMASGDDDDSFLVEENLPEKFLKAAEACLGFARDRPDILRLLAKKNMEAVVLNGSPFLFKNGENSARRMKLFLSGEESNELELERAQTIDIMRYLLSYAYGPFSSSHDSNLKSDELVEPSVRKLLCELFNLSGTVWKPKSVDATLTELPLSNDQLSAHPGQYIETKTADWINPKIPGRSSAASESQLNASCNNTDKEHGNSIFNQRQGPEVTLSSQTGGISTPNCRFIENSAQPSTSVLDKNVESWNRIQTSGISSAQISNESNAVYGSINSSEPPSHLGNSFNNYYGGYTGKPTQPSGNLWTKTGASYGGSTAKSSPPPGNSWNEQHSTSYKGYDVNTSQQSSNSSSNSSTSYGGSTASLSQPPSNSWSNYNTFAGYGVNSAQPSSTVWSKSSTPGGSIVNPSQPPPRDLWSNYNTANSTQPSSNSWSNNIASTESTPNPSQPPSGYQGNYNYGARYDGYSNASQTGFTSNSSQTPSGYQGTRYDGHSNASQTGFTSNSSQPPSGYQGTRYDGHSNASQTGFTSNSSQTPSGYQGTRYDGHSNASQTEFTSNSSQPPSGYQGTRYDGHSNASQTGFTSNSSQTPSGYQGTRYDGHSNASQTGFTSNSSQPPSGYQGTRYDGHSNASQTGFTSNSSQTPSGYQGTRYDGHSNASQTGFTSNSSQPPSNSWNTYNTSPGGFKEQLKQPSSNSYGASTAYSPQAPNYSWNKYDTPYGENVMKSTQPSSNSWNTSNTSFGWPTTSSSHPPSNSWNNQNTNTANSAEPSTSSMNSNNSHVGYSADSYHRYPANSNQTSSYSWNNSSTSFPGASANPPQLSSSSWNNSREGFSSGFPQANNGLPAQAHSLNGGVNGNYGYSGKSLEGSCVKEPDPLDMSEEAKAERWFRRAAQIKDISELSQIPDEDFPQIMPLRKGVNRFVVSKRKTPLERRLASQQYKRSLPVVSSELEKDPTAGEKEN